MLSPANDLEKHQIVLLVDDDPMITEGLAAELSRPGRTVVTCNDLESAEITVDWLKPSHVVSDVRLTSQFGCEGLDFIRFVKRKSPDTRTILMTGDGPDALQMEAAERGAVGFLCKPFEIADLNSLLDMMAPVREGSADWPDIISVPTMDEVLTTGLLSTVFQPIVRLPGGDHLGYEALTRCRSDSWMRNPETLFHYATRKDQVVDLELACIRNSLRAAATLPEWAALFINVHPAAFSAGPKLQEVIVQEAAGAGIGLNRIVLEITEQAPLNNQSAAMMVIARMKQAGIRFAFDDIGIAYSHLPFMDQVGPAFLKISQNFGTGFEADPVKNKIVRNILALAQDFECGLILEGIETAETATAATELGIKFGQGFYFARPSPAQVWK